MSFAWFYILALLPVFIGLGTWLFSKRFALWEWMTCSAIAFAVAGICHAASIAGMTSDCETWSGQITQAKQFSAWKEYYEYAVYRTEHRTGTRTVSDGKGGCRTQTYTYTVQVFDHWQPTSTWHNATWACYSNIETSYSIDENRFRYFVKQFKDRQAIKGKRTTMSHNSRMLEGDPNDYISDNKTGWIEPVSKPMKFENRVKACPSVFSFIQVPEKIKVFEYPKNSNPFSSDRLLGDAGKHISAFEWDQLNARLGPYKFVNLILAGFEHQDSSIAEYQKAKWIGGKKNDLVLCYGKGWSRVFGWTEKDVVKRNLETILLENPINAKIIPLIETEVRANYTIKDWSKFNYLSIEPRPVHFAWLLTIMIITQSSLIYLFHKN